LDLFQKVDLSRKTYKLNWYQLSQLHKTKKTFFVLKFIYRFNMVGKAVKENVPSSLSPPCLLHLSHWYNT